ncbi:hypothetical protein Tco_0772476 [Tanacetum coccineum]|uniref:Uncharacterized protein n=1 Tax=Tanacetum coccineum TaxID=301880 RepID=A0ABQ4ZIX0_9ASTR
MKTNKPLFKDAYGEDVDEHLYRSMIRSLMYLTSLRPDIMFADSPFDLVAFTDSDYAGASLDRKSTIGDLNEKNLIQMIKIHTDQNVADLLTKAFDVSIFQYLIAILESLRALLNYRLRRGLKCKYPADNTQRWLEWNPKAAND